MLALPLFMGAVLLAWHGLCLGYYEMWSLVTPELTVFILALVASLFIIGLRGPDSQVLRYVETLIIPFRGTVVGLACVVMGGVHFLSLHHLEPFYLQMGFLVCLLGFMEAGTITNYFGPHLSPSLGPTTESLRSLLFSQSLLLLLAFLLSVGAFLLSLLGVVGFTQVWSVLVLAAILLLVIALITVVRKL